MKKKPKILILMGSDSDLPVMNEAAAVLVEFGVTFQMTVASAHRTPARAADLAANAEKRGIGVIIAGAGMAAHLAGVVAAHTILPVIGVPLDASPMKGLDALLSTVQMPPGIPVATVAVGKAGARNAGILALQILARSDRGIAAALKAFKRRMVRDVDKKARRVESASTPVSG